MEHQINLDDIVRNLSYSCCMRQVIHESEEAYVYPFLGNWFIHVMLVYTHDVNIRGTHISIYFCFRLPGRGTIYTYQA